ncbi:aminoglycoside phosphotransferase family protein [Mycolicibacterium parafortuitum]|uniref:Aminoglycoside/hydroxyurea antibiotic resistance kinase [Nocardioides sp. JS614] n=1 Tax=Mycolicibacterium parafortuitum TaxID=39692 RepID=A0A375YII7_MYCPF|nr:aminoglycoside phosphotransferase family protein [Mycolicibacterium parafortuitum]ORB32248.1 aminoglycoside resistance protein [Mycolicibacterium parafortuitum]SRX80928.1 aminoglycoside/hydroxyurea antibiotic resistance kinase [Nocardioides sp. JS614] [Mycolicibacterium parafortuitum]
MDTVRDLVDAWALRPDGERHRSPRADVLPVRTADGVAAVLKVAAPGETGQHAHLVLRRWGGDGAVRLLRADPHRDAVLLERACATDLSTLPEEAACGIVADLYRRLHVPAMPQLRSLTADVAASVDELDKLPRGSAIPHRLVEHAASLARELSADSSDDVVLHGNLHHANVLAARRAPWLAISPRPRNGDPHYELAPMLWHGWDAFAGNIRDGIRGRFWMLVDITGLDEDRARAWTLVRVVLAAVRELSGGGEELTRYVALAKAIQD